MKRAGWICLAAFLAALAIAGYLQWRSSHRAENENPSRTADLPAWESLRREVEEDREFRRAQEILRRLRNFRDRHVGSRWEGRASRLEASYRRGLEARADAALLRLRERSAPLLKEGRLGRMLDLYQGFPGEFLEETRAGKSVTAEVRDLRSRIEKAHARDRSAVETLLRDGKLAGAEARLRSMEVYAGEGQHAWIREARKRLDEGTAERRRLLMDRYLRTDGEFRRFMKASDYRAAAGVVTRFLDGPWSDEDRPFVFKEGVDYGSLRRSLGAWRREEVLRTCAGVDPRDPESLSPAEAALADMLSAVRLDAFRERARIGLERALSGGKKETYVLEAFGGVRGYFARQGDRVYFHVLSEARSGPFDLLRSPTASDLILLAERAWDADPAKARERFSRSASGQASAGLLCHFSGALRYARRAEAYLERAVGLGARGVAIYLAGMRAAAVARRGIFLEALYRRAREAREERRFEDAWKALDELMHHEDHAFVRTRRAEIKRMLEGVNKGLSRVQRLSLDLRGKAESVGKGSIRVSYDFSDPGQIEAFESIKRAGRRPLHGRWRVRSGGLESGGVASALRWKTSVRGDFQVEYDLLPLEKPQNIVTDLYYREGRRSHYAVTFGFDWVGKAMGDRDDTAEDRFGMPRLCVIKYPIEVDVRAWTRPEMWVKWRKALVGRRVGVGEVRAGEKVRVAIQREGRVIRVRLDGRAVWEGEDGEYGEGSILFFSDSRARIERLAFTFGGPP